MLVDDVLGVMWEVVVDLVYNDYVEVFVVIDIDFN